MADDKPQNADFIGRVVSDAKNPPETRMLTGWFGDSGEEGYRRLYTDAELNCYVDIPDDAILYTEPLRDVQPSGCVLVWIKRDAAVKQGGSASSRAARFLQGQVQQDFASAGAAGSLDQAGLRCVTVVPCGEPTGFTGQCTKQPDVGGAWPCVTAIPHCFEVTGFTGKCTHAPWPNPTRYIGCTYLHCPTHDLTHIPHICNIVASGQPGCVVVNPPQGGETVPNAGAAEVDEKAVPATSLPGCGYTKTWGVCETHLLGCGVTKDCPAAFAAPGGAAAQPASAICATAIGCDITVFCPTRFQPHCFQTLICATQPQQCFPIPSPFCPVTQACPFGPGGGGDPAQRFAAFGAVAPAITGAVPCVSVGGTCTNVHGCTVPPTSPDLGCTQSGPACPTNPKTICTQSGPQCPTSCGPECQSQQVNCTQVGQICGHDLCPSLGIACTALPPCPGPTVDPQCPPTKLGPPCPTPQLDCTFGCTQAGTGCPVTAPQVICANPADAQAFAAQAVGPRPAPLTQVGCPPSDFVACSLFGGCPTLPKGDCTFFGCPSLPQFAAAGPGGGCTQSGPQCPTHAQPQCTLFGPGCPPTPATICTQFAPCPTHARPQCTLFGPACPPTPATICTQFAPCPTHQQPCNTPGFECTMFCTQQGPQCPLQTVQGPACPVLTAGGPQCPVHSGFNCPSAIGCQSIACQSIACQSIACQPGGGGQQQQFAAPAGGGGIHPTLLTQPILQCNPSAVDACPTRICTQQIAQCHPSVIEACPTQPILQCNPSAVDACPTRLCTHQVLQCNPSAVDACPTRFGCPTQNPQQCPVASGFNCPSQFGCQSIACGQSVACVSAGCQPGGGVGRQVGGSQWPQCPSTVCTFEGPTCPATWNPQCPSQFPCRTAVPCLPLPFL